MHFSNKKKSEKAGNQGKPGGKEKVGDEEAKPVTLRSQLLSPQPEGTRRANENNVLLSQPADVIDFFLAGV